ncbi:antibiotic biosynthesis monooxygenase [Algoriphagus aestuariicola]|uniref:Antibiotic biosynthesis monooxygenase n=1 Tax=Algoriphagus aestuariicola TaxID=1852016 RepID=A0ABS3BXA5_9BACT|nr:antibiotic biosynthesis monooxygenase family protein [Algoriphagus aestuariicola]MBN7803491.1 antibiotic biosynthesis monooxygenase [Algoriphagus aestuariicola]
MLVRIVRMTFRPDAVAEFLANFETHKNSIRHFPGCKHLELWQDVLEKNIFTTYSHWESEEALDQYRDSELFKSVWKATKTLFSAKPKAFSSKKTLEVP